MATRRRYPVSKLFMVDVRLDEGKSANGWALNG